MKAGLRRSSSVLFLRVLFLTTIPLCGYGQGKAGCARASHRSGYGHYSANSGWDRLIFALIGDIDQPVRHVVDAGVSVSAYNVSVLYKGSAKFTPGYLLSLRYHLSDRIALDLTAGTGNIAGKNTCTCTDNPRPYNFEIKTAHIATGVSAMYFTSRYMQAYGGLQVGVVHFKETDSYLDGGAENRNGTSLTGQVTLLGLRFGRRFGVFGEIGLGCRGLFNVGISFQPGLPAF